MGTYTVVDASKGGLDIAGAAVSSSDKYPNSGKEVLLVKNGSGGSINVTIVTPGTADGNAIADLVIAIADGVTKAFGPYKRGTYNDVDGNVNVNYSGVSSVTAKVLRVNPETT